MDYNCWFQAEGSVLRWGNEVLDKNAFLNFLKKRNLDEHSIFADPKFVAPEQNDYRLSVDSPARRLQM